ncbi:MAG: pilus assembly protein, partial [Acidobacteria bacterium]|nr:pilus assembly protein [Acidobacteriota bacterium]
MVELAVCLPTLIFVMLMAMEAADVIFLKQTLHIAAYEAARTAIKPGATRPLAEDAADGQDVAGLDDLARDVPLVLVRGVPVAEGADDQVAGVDVDARAFAVLDGRVAAQLMDFGDHEVADGRGLARGGRRRHRRDRDGV